VLVIAVVFFGSIAFSSPATVEQEKLINSLSANQLYELYAEQTFQLSEEFFPGINTFINPNMRSKLKDCFITQEKNIFTEKEMREIFIQPIGMDTNYYQRKIYQMTLGFESCVYNLQRN
jgi:hypothetical protein